MTNPHPLLRRAKVAIKKVLRPVWFRFRPRIQLTLGVTDHAERLQHIEHDVGRLQARQREIELVLQHIGALPTRPAGDTPRTPTNAAK